MYFASNSNVFTKDYTINNGILFYTNISFTEHIVSKIRDAQKIRGFVTSFSIEEVVIHG